MTPPEQEAVEFRAALDKLEREVYWLEHYDEARARVLALYDALRAENERLKATLDDTSRRYVKDAAALKGDLARECNDADETLRAFGLEPKAHRTDGGSLLLARIRAAGVEARESIRQMREELADYRATLTRYEEALQGFIDWTEKGALMHNGVMVRSAEICADKARAALEPPK